MKPAVKFNSRKRTHRPQRIKIHSSVFALLVMLFAKIHFREDLSWEPRKYSGEE
jgi:hypothetical protein